MCIPTQLQRFGLQALSLTTLALASSSPALGQEPIFVEQGGLVVVETEPLLPLGDWTVASTTAGHTGTGFVSWTGPNHFHTPNHDIFGFDVEISAGGVYDFRMRNYHDHPDPTEENDVWVRLDGGPWIKSFSPINNQWTWATHLELTPTFKPPASFSLSPGRHRFEFSGRSHDFRIDRVHLALPGTPGATDPNRPESETLRQNKPPVAVMRMIPDQIPLNDNFQTVVRLDASQSFDPDSSAPLDFRWHLRGGHFVQGTSASDEIAYAVFGGGRALPVQLRVEDGEPRGVATATRALNIMGNGSRVLGAPVAWQPLEVWFTGPGTNENASSPNPFLDHRLNVRFEGPSGQVYNVPGFFAGNGSGASQGNVWKARFSADEGGLWTYTASFRSGPGVAVSLNANAGTPGYCDGRVGQVAVLATDPEAPGFLRRGRLSYTGEHYLEFGEGGHFVKGGTDSPENFLGYAGFDDVQDNGNLGIIHRYESHQRDFVAGDPYWVANSGVDSKGIIGALNYLGKEGVNGLYFLPMNLGGDGQETCPFVGYSNTVHNKTHYDLSRMYQWNQVFEHAQRQGIFLQVVLAETEAPNELWLDGGTLGTERKLFFRELVARFGHVLGIKWNLSEENDYSVAQLRQFASHLDALDAYDHPIAVHTHPNNFQDYEELLGDPLFSATSIQYNPNLVSSFVEEWRVRSENAGRKWVLDMDENGPWNTGLMDDNAASLRKQVLFDTYFSGGQIEWYAGYHALPLGGDLKMEDFRTRYGMWRTMRIAREFVESLPFVEMEPASALVTGESQTLGGATVFAKPDEVYAVYLPVADGAGQLHLNEASGNYHGRWWNPIRGQHMGSVLELAGGLTHPLPSPPNRQGEDWVLLVQRVN